MSDALFLVRKESVNGVAVEPSDSGDNFYFLIFNGRDPARPKTFGDFQSVNESAVRFNFIRKRADFGKFFYIKSNIHTTGALFPKRNPAGIH